MTISDMEPQITATVLAGGRSVRMGRDKRAIEVDGRSLLGRAIDAVAPLADEILVSCRADDPPALDGLPPVRLVFDERGEGPLAGIEAALRAAANPWLLVVPVDMLWLRSDIVFELVVAAALAREPGLEAVVFAIDGELLPLPMLVHRRALPALTAQLGADDYRVRHFLESVDKLGIYLDPASRAEVTRNANRPADLPAADLPAADPSA